MVSWEDPQQQPAAAEAPGSTTFVYKFLFRGIKYFHKASCFGNFDLWVSIYQNPIVEPFIFVSLQGL